MSKECTIAAIEFERDKPAKCNGSLHKCCQCSTFGGLGVEYSTGPYFPRSHFGGVHWMYHEGMNLD
jgi:hypothetical protein